MTSAFRRALVALLALSFLATVAALLFGRRFSGYESVETDSFSKHALGSEAAIKVLGRLGAHVSKRHDPKIDPEGPLLFFEPTAEIPGGPFGHSKLGDVLKGRAARKRISVVVLPKWEPGLFGRGVVAVPDETREAILDAAALGASFTGTVSASAPKWLTATAQGELGALAVALPSAQTITPPPRFHVLLGTGDNALIVASPDGMTVVVSDPDLFHNFNLARAEHATILHALLVGWTGADALAVDEVFHGHWQGHSLTEALARFPNVLFTMWAVLTALLVVAMGIVRFGPPKRVRAASFMSPTTAIRNAAGVMALAKDAGSWLASRYVEGVLRDLAARYGVTAETPEERASAVDAALGAARQPQGAAALLARAKALAGPLPRASRGKEQARARRLALDAHAFRQRAIKRAAPRASAATSFQTAVSASTKSDTQEEAA
jgi:hypothetical protein